MRRRQHPHGRQGGQAVAEFLVAAVLLLVPMFLAVAALGKFVDVQHVATMAARYGAWERTVWYDASGTDFNGINGPNQKSAPPSRARSRRACSATAPAPPA